MAGILEVCADSMESALAAERGGQIGLNCAEIL